MEEAVKLNEEVDVFGETDSIPYPLAKSCGDPFIYAMKLRSGEIVVYEEANIKGEWVNLSGIKEFHQPSLVAHPVPPPRTYPQLLDLNGPMTFERGMSVRISDIVWVADAPWGS